MAPCWIQKWWGGWGLRRDRPWGVGHVVFQHRAGCSCSLRKTEQKSPSGLHKTSTQGAGILTRLSGFSVVWYFFFFFLTMDFCLLNCLFWCDLKFRPKMFTKEKQLNNSNLAKAISNWKLFLWSILDTVYVKWVHHLHPALKFWHNWNQSNLEDIAGKDIVLLTPEKGLHWRKRKE